MKPKHQHHKKPEQEVVSIGAADVGEMPTEASAGSVGNALLKLKELEAHIQEFSQHLRGNDHFSQKWVDVASINADNALANFKRAILKANRTVTPPQGE